MTCTSSLNILLLATILLTALRDPGATADETKKHKYPADVCNPVIIAHRGASGYVPEHTLGAYALAITMGADYIEPDLVMTKDGHLVACHENNIALTTDVAEHPEFASKRKTEVVDGRVLTGWFTEDFTLAELKTLRVIERTPTIRPGNSRMDKAFEIPTLQEIIDLVQTMQIGLRRSIGIFPETKHSTHFQSLDLAMEQPLVDTLHKNGYDNPEAPVFIQSFEVTNLKQLSNMTKVNLVQLLYTKSLKPQDQCEMGSNLTYGDMATPAGLMEVARYASAVGPDKGYIIPRNQNGKLGQVTSFVEDAHAAGLKVYPYTFRAENVYLPVEFRSRDPLRHAIGNFTGELQAFMATGIDGLFADQPDVPLKIRAPCP